MEADRALFKHKDRSGFENRVSGLIVIAQKKKSTWKARFTETVHHGTTVQCPPVSDESTLEVDTFVTLLSWDRKCSA
ncbi:hypothetical protein L0152_31885 [bacterium]|nr:hypothetical protein [bacterium]